MTVYTVGQVAQYIKQLLSGDDLLRDLWLSGEVSNLRGSQSGHAYFTVKDDSSQLRCVMFRNGVGMDMLADGSAITTHGYVSFYNARGSLDFMADIVVAEGLGALSLKFERLKAALEREGLFDPSRKRPLPRFPQVIGLVTSPQGAVYHDICNVLSRRYPMAELVLAPTTVQGGEAARGIQRALELLNEDGRSDVIILARGGGSLEELWPFNEEAVARAIYASRIPVVSAVGHETDFTIADFVADVRAPTPSAAAELVAPDKLSLQMAIGSLLDRLAWGQSADLTEHKSALSDMVYRLERGTPDVDGLRRRVDDISQQAALAMSTGVGLRDQGVKTLETRLLVLDPVATLKRGFSVVEHQQDGELVSSLAKVRTGDQLKVTVSDGSYPAVAGSAVKKGRAKPEKAVAGARLFS